MAEENKNSNTNLEKLRDEKVFPIAREVLKDMEESLLPEDANVEVNYNPLILKILQKSLAADLNISTESTFLFQVINGVLAGLNATVQKAYSVPIDDVRYAAIGKKVLGYVADANVRLGPVTPEEVEVDFSPVKEKIDSLFQAEQLSMLEIKYIMDNIFSGFTAVSNGYNISLEQSTQKAEAKLFGIETMPDLTMGRLNEVLVAQVDNSKDIAKSE